MAKLNFQKSLSLDCLEIIIASIHILVLIFLWKLLNIFSEFFDEKSSKEHNFFEILFVNKCI